MAAGVNVALCPRLLYRSYICPVREPRHFTPSKSTGEAETAVSRLFFYVHVASPPLPAPSSLSPFEPLSRSNLYAWQDAFPGITLNHSVLCSVGTTSHLYVCVCDFILELYFCRSGYESSMTTGPRTIDATMDYLQTCLIFYLLILCFCGGRSIDICE